jgi:hypothetical protein
MTTLPSAHEVPGLTRRRLIGVGAAGAATLWLGGFDRLASIAGASTTSSSLRRSGYLSLSDLSFAVSVDGATHTLELIGVGDLPIAATVPTLIGLDDAFALYFRGTATDSFAGGTRVFQHPDLGEFSLFVSPVDQPDTTQVYEAIIDRTVRVPGLDDDGAPAPVDPPRRRADVVIRNRRHHRRHRRHRHHGR